MWETAVIKSDIRSTSKTKVMCNKILISTGGYIWPSMSLEITCAAIKK